MPDQDSHQESDERSILDSDDSADGSASHEASSSPSEDPAESSPSSPASEESAPEENDPMAEAQDQIAETQEQTADAQTQPDDEDSAAGLQEDLSAESEEPPSPEEVEDVDNLHFEDDDLGETLRHASDEQLNDAPFGIIRVDDEGIVEFFNRYESDLSGMDPEEVMGRNFFTQVAPCTNNRLFRGRFKKGVRRGDLDETFTYTYTYKMRPTLVDVHLYRDEEGNNWITVQKY